MEKIENIDSKINLVDIEEFRDFLECPVCIRIPESSPIYQCPNGHVVCNVCHAKLKQCPVCRANLGKTRSLVAEKIMSKLPKSCENSEHGCKVLLIKDQLTKHEQKCQYRIVQCPHLDCTTKIYYKNMMKHLKGKKSYLPPTFVVENQVITKGWTVPFDCFERSGSGSPSYLGMAGRIFFLENVRYVNTMWYTWIYLLGTKEEAESFFYEIKVTNPKQGEVLTYLGQVVSCDLDVTNVLTNVSVLTFTDATARRFLDGMVLKCNVKIIKKSV